MLAVLLLAGSTFIYLVFRSDTLIGFNLIDRLGLSAPLYGIREAFSNITLPAFYVYSLPDGLWLLSYMLLIDSILPYHPTKPIWILALPANAIASEIAQYWMILPGQYDVRDLVCYLVPTVLYISLKRMKYTTVHFFYDRVTVAPLILVSYLFIAGCSVECLNTPFVITCAVFASVLMALCYNISRKTLPSGTRG